MPPETAVTTITAVLGDSVLRRVDAGHYTLTYRGYFTDTAWLLHSLPAGADWDCGASYDDDIDTVLHLHRRVLPVIEN